MIWMLQPHKVTCQQRFHNSAQLYLSYPRPLGSALRITHTLTHTLINTCIHALNNPYQPCFSTYLILCVYFSYASVNTLVHGVKYCQLLALDWYFTKHSIQFPQSSPSLSLDLKALHWHSDKKRHMLKLYLGLKCEFFFTWTRNPHWTTHTFDTVKMLP